MEEIIARTTYKNKNLVIYKDQNQICFGKLENNKIITNLPLEEQEILKNVYQQITIDKQNSVDCGTFKIQGKQIKIYYCKKSNLYYFYEIVNNKLQIPKQQLLTELNIYYNNEQETLHYIEDKIEQYKNNMEKLDDIPNQTKTDFKKHVKLYMATLSVILAGNVAFQELPVLNYELYYYTTPKTKIEQEEQYSFSKIKQAIETNHNLSEEEKAYFLLLQQELKENQAYINQEKICKTLNDIKINYLNQNHEVKTDSGKMRVGGSYSLKSNEINLYKLNISELQPKILFHEINHSLTDFKQQSQEDLLLSHPNYLLEMTNELFSVEYFEEIAQSNSFIEGTSYSNQMVVMYPLCEILDDKTIRNYKFNGKANVILEELLSIDSDMNKAANLITAINSIELYQNNAIEKYNKVQEVANETKEKQDAALQEFYNAKQEQDENKQVIYNLVKNYYEKKYNYSMNEDQMMMAYFSNPKFRISEAEDQIKSIYGENSFNSCIFIEEINPKGYISENYKKNHKNIELIYTKDGIDYIVKIDNNNRYSKDKITPIPINNITEEIPYVHEETFKTR